ncbi:hypothetical protein KC19_3G168600 [Ceratodon purpureus]|uniref:Uncharacterized protein n=1 Tax=Ceratodon purpureus TaxID=3225 RepID=A0A8T0IMU2_CERPU|nr:hypothetical protein KC19_3G168600 [Ceratodon purpureus]
MRGTLALVVSRLVSSAFSSERAAVSELLCYFLSEYVHSFCHQKSSGRRVFDASRTVDMLLQLFCLLFCCDSMSVGGIAISRIVLWIRYCVPVTRSRCCVSALCATCNVRVSSDLAYIRHHVICLIRS